MGEKKSNKEKSKFTWTDIAKSPTTIIAVLLARPLFPNEYVPTFIIMSMILLGQALHTSFKLLKSDFSELSKKIQTAIRVLALTLIGLAIITGLALSVGLMIHYFNG